MCSAFLLGLIFYFKPGYTQNITAEFMSASLVPKTEELSATNELPETNESSLENDLPSVQVLQVHQKTQQETQEELDDIAEKIDLIAQQVADLIESSKPKAEEKEVVLQNENIDELKLVSDKDPEVKTQVLEIPLPPPPPSPPPPPPPPPPVIIRGGGGSPKAVYLKILISEVQASPIDNRFIELFNPNETEVNLTDWYLQRKTETADSWSSLVSSTKFEGKIISANGYFLISRSDANADILLDSLTLTENNFLVLKDPNRDISDEIGWSKIAENLSWCREFENCFPTPKSQNEIYVEPPKDTTPPEINFSLAPTQSNLNFTVDFAITDPLGAVTPSGVVSYIFRWKEELGDWQEDLPAEIVGLPMSYNLTRDFVGEDQKTYYFQIKSKDSAGNESDWLPTEPAFTKVEIPAPVEIKPILINEIQVEGQTTKDEFIELYNPNNFEINLTDFSLKKKTSGGNESNLVSAGSFTGTISALGYFLIVPQNNEDETPNYTGSAIPDLYYSGKSYSVASNNTVLLYDKNDALQDKVGFGEASDFETASTQNPEAGKSIQRKNLGEDTNDNSQDFIISETPTPRSE